MISPVKTVFSLFLGILCSHAGAADSPAVKAADPQSAKPGIARQLSDRGTLWAAAAQPGAAGDLAFPVGIEHLSVERSDSDRFHFLHDPAIAAHKGILFAAWYNCPDQEIVGESLIRGRRSTDGGRTWSAVEVIAEDREGTGVFYVPVQLLSHQGALYAFVGKMTGHDLITACLACVLDERTDTWTKRGEIADLFLPNCGPVKMADGNWIMAGRVAARLGRRPLIPAVAISAGDKLTERWRVVPLRAEEMPAGQHPETTVVVEGSEIVALSRNSLAPAPFVYASEDFGRTWREIARPGFSAVTSKLYAGMLSTGQYYVVFNYPMPGKDGGNNRGVLALAVSHPGEMAWSRVWKIQDNAPGHPRSSHYPCAIEDGGRLLVVYTAGLGGRRQCELAAVPLASLRIE